MFIKPVRPLRLVTALTCSLVFTTTGCFANSWSEISAPLRGSARSIGRVANGCIAGATILPRDGLGFQVMHLERNRYWGHPNLIETLQQIGREVARQGLGHLHIGDLSQPRGGPMPFGHRSHQSGLDADIWFDLDPNLHLRLDPLRANLSAPSMLNAARKGLDHGLWNRRHHEVLKIATEQAEMERIFVNPHIKRELCRDVRGDHRWLHKIRPWYGHDDHFHIRLNCPPGSPECEAQEPVPAGDGCDAASLDWWLQQPLPPSKPQPVPILPMPDSCRQVLNSR